MKFGIKRKPSLRKSIAARTSIKRYVRQNSFLKHPLGYGWSTDPKKALYNRVYNHYKKSRSSFFGLGLVLFVSVGIFAFYTLL